MELVPTRVHLARGSAEGRSDLTAFDNALRDAGIADLNLVRVSSIVPRGAILTERPPSLPVGTVVHAVYTSVASDVPGELVSACVGAGTGVSGGVLMEHSCHGPADEAERAVRAMIEEAFEGRGWALDRVLLTTSEHKVERRGCAVAAALLLGAVPAEERR